MRNVFSNQELAHIFASRTQDSGQSNNGNFYFTGDTLFSYGSHFPVAMFYGDSVLFNSDSYSNSTCKHVNYARQALSHVDAVYLPDLAKVIQIINCTRKDARESYAREYITRLQGDIDRISDKLSRMRSEHTKRHAQGNINALEAAGAFVWFNLCKRRSDPFTTANKANKAKLKAKHVVMLANINDSAIKESVQLIESSIKEGMQELDATRANRDASNISRNMGILRSQNLQTHHRKSATRVMGKAWLKRYDSQVEKQLKALATLQPSYSKLADHVTALLTQTNAEKVERWLSGESVYLPRELMVLRVQNERLETSQGANVPIKDAIRIARLAAICRAKGEGWKRNGEQHPVGIYQTDEITANGELQIGCHWIPWSTMVDCVNRFIPELKGVVA